MGSVNTLKPHPLSTPIISFSPRAIAYLPRHDSLSHFKTLPAVNHLTPLCPAASESLRKQHRRVLSPEKALGNQRRNVLVQHVLHARTRLTKPRCNRPSRHNQRLDHAIHVVAVRKPNKSISLNLPITTETKSELTPDPPQPSYSAAAPADYTAPQQGSQTCRPRSQTDPARYPRQA